MSKIIESTGELVKFGSAYCTNSVEVVPSGEEIYTWQYQDSEGSLVDESTNVYEKIQSYRKSVDYKEQIERGELFDDTELNYLDISELGNSPDAVSDYLANLRAKIDQDVADFKKQAEQALADIAKSGQVVETDKGKGEQK